jgi:putative PIN family toxin of toxin-antitoxin system
VRQIVLDTNVLVSALRSNLGASFRLLQLVGKSDAFRINLSVPLVLEYEAVLLRQRAKTGLTSADIADVIDYLCSVAGLHSVFFLWRPILRDPNDDFILELAVRAGTLCIGDLRRSAGAALTIAFRRQYW